MVTVTHTHSQQLSLPTALVVIFKCSLRTYVAPSCFELYESLRKAFFQHPIHISSMVYCTDASPYLVNIFRHYLAQSTKSTTQMRPIEGWPGT